MAKKALLMILDGWGCGDRQKDDVIFNTPTPYWDSLLANYPHSQLQASGENVGLPDGQMGWRNRTQDITPLLDAIIEEYSREVIII